MLNAKFLVIFVGLCFFKVYAVPPDAKTAAHRIYTDVAAKQSLAEFTANRQFAYLYFQKADKDTIFYTSSTVSNKLAGQERLRNLVGAAAWPTLPSNLRIAGPNANTQPGSNVGHAEQKMLSDFDAMYNGVFPAPQSGPQPCPAYIILATKLFPCYTSDTVSCGKTFIAATATKLAACTTPQTIDQFLYLYVGKNAANDWNIQKKNFAENDIKIIYGPN